MQNNITPKVDDTNWKMTFEFAPDQFGEKLPDDPDFAVSSSVPVTSEPVQV